MRPIFASIIGVAVWLPTITQAQNVAIPGRLIDIKVGEYFILAPDTSPAGLVTLRLSQTGDAVKPWPADTAKLREDLTYHFHMVWLVRLDSAKTFSDLYKAESERRPTPWATIIGGPGFADAPGSSNVSVVLTPGNYALVCYVGSAREDRGRYHLLKGMIRPLTVTPSSSSVSLPEPALTITLRGDSIIMADTLRAGTRQYLIRNEGERPADFHVSVVKAGYTVEQARSWRPRMMTEPPRKAVGGVVYVTPTRPLITTLLLEPGDHLFNGKHIVVR
jgi:hypothetical protein